MATITDEMKLVIIAEVEKAIDAMGDWEDSLDSAEKQADEAAKKMEADFKNLEKAANKMASSMLVWTGAVTAGGIAGLKFAGDIESQNVAFEVLTGSAETAIDLYEELNSLSIKTPLEPEQVNRAAEALLTFQFGAEGVSEELTRLGDLAKGKPELLDRITTAYGRIHLKGKASMEELNMLTEAGVPILAELSKQYDVTTEELMNMVSKGKVGFGEVQDAVVAMTSEGGQFNGMMEKMSQTLDGKLSTAVGSLKLALADASEEFVPIAKEMLDTVAELANRFTELDDSTKRAILTAIGISAAVGPMMKFSLGIGKTVSQMRSLVSVAKLAGPLLLNPWGALAVGVAAATTAIILHRKEMKETIEEYQAAVATSEKAIAEIASGDWIQKLADWESLDTNSLDEYIDASNKKLRALGSQVKLTRMDIIQLINDVDSMGFDKTLVEQLGITDEELSKIQDFNGDLNVLGDALARLSQQTEKSLPTWKEWFETVTGVDPDQFSNQKELGPLGAQAAEAYLEGIRSEMDNAQSFSEAIGQVFDPKPYLEKQKAEIEKTLRALFDIDPEKVMNGEAFNFDGTDSSVNSLLAALQAVDSALGEIGKTGEEADKSPAAFFDQLYAQEEAALQERAEAAEAYRQIQEAISDAQTTEELTVYAQMAASLEEAYGFTKDLADESDIVAETWAQLGENIAAVAENAAADYIADSFSAIGEALANGTSMADAAGQAFREFAQGLTSQISQMMVAAGLKLILAGQIGPGLVLIALGGVTGLASGLFGGGSENYGAYNYESYIPSVIDQERELHEARMEYLQKELEEAKKARSEGLKDLERSISQEFSVLRDQWERNLISTDEFQTGMAALNNQYDTTAADLDAPVEDAEAAKEAEEEAQKALEEARGDKLAELATEALKYQEELNDMGWWERTFTSNDTDLKKKIDKIDARMKVVETARTIAAIQAAALGADFMTDGPQLLLVGDNPGGRERVQVTPVSSPNINGPQNGGSSLVIQGDIYGIDDLYGKLKEAGFRLQATGRG